MSYNNFKPTFWSTHIQTENEKFCVLQKLCDYKFEKEAKGKGDKIKILGIERPTIGKFTGADIPSPEAVNDSSVYLEITEADYFSFLVGDVDKAQGADGLLEVLTKEASKGMAESRDTFIAELAALGTTLRNADAGAQLNTQALIKAAVDNAFVGLWDNGVKFADDTYIVLTPWAYNLFKNELTELKTANDELIKTGVLGLYNNASVYMSNNLYSITAGGKTNECMLVGSKKAMAFASVLDEVEAYRYHPKFADAVQGINNYGAKVVRPKELYIIRGRLTA